MGEAELSTAGTREVKEFIAGLPRPLQDEVTMLRSIILQADENLTEHIKWNAPSFCINGDDRITFNLNGRGFLRLIFHLGAKKRSEKLEKPLINDPYNLLQWAANDRAILKLTGQDDIKQKEENIRELVQRWLKAGRQLPQE